MKNSKFINTLKSFLYFPSIIFKLVSLKTRYYFIFPSWQIGGGERVHIDILRIVKPSKPICIITNVQYDEGLKDEFKKNANLLYLWRWGTKRSLKPMMLKVLAKFINRNPQALVFGSNTVFFYDLIPYLAPHVKVIDLTHSITPKHEWLEIISLEWVDRYYKRIILGNSALEGFKKIYLANKIPLSYANHFQIIKNKVDIPSELPMKDFSENLEVIFVARNSPEKRAELFFEIAHRCKEQGIKANFTIIGAFEKDYGQHADAVYFAGRINNKTELNRYYKKAHLILMTSTFEGFPMVLLESMAFGVVPISTAVGEIPFHVSEEKQTGFLIRETSSEDDLVKQFVSTLERCTINIPLLKSFSIQARKHVEDNFSAEDFESAYQTLLDVKYSKSTGTL